MEILEKLNKIVDYLNEHYNQDSCDNYDNIIRFDEDTAISLWACGAIVCIEDILYFITEDDGSWWINQEESDNIAMQDAFSIGWINNFTEALTKLADYVNEYGFPVYFPDTEVICHYSLRKSND